MDVNKYPVLTLAFVGDAHYGLIVKERVIDQAVKITEIQKLANKYISARAQARFTEYFLENGIFTEEELEIYKRGRNAKSHKAPRNTDVVTYHVSTGFEAVWGYLYLSGNETRLEQLWNIIETLGV